MQTIKQPYRNVVIVGCGGVGSWLAHLLARLLPKLDPIPTLILQDGDRLEEGNLDRQLFGRDLVGKNKAEALMAILPGHNDKIMAVPEYFHAFAELPLDTLIVCCVDNHPARSYVLDACDLNRAHAIIAANETTSSEAYIYIPEWKGGAGDPRQYYPEILTDQSGDVTGAASCVMLAQTTTPQLALANYMAAGMAAYLFWFLVTEASKLQGEDVALWPVHHTNSLYRFSSQKLSQKPQPVPERTNGNSNINPAADAECRADAADSGHCATACGAAAEAT